MKNQLALGLLALSMSSCVLEGDGCRFEGHSRWGETAVSGNCPNAGFAMRYKTDGEHHGVYTVGRFNESVVWWSESNFEPTNPWKEGR